MEIGIELNRESLGIGILDKSAESLTNNRISICHILNAHAYLFHTEIHFNIVHLQERVTIVQLLLNGFEINFGANALCEIDGETLR